MPEPWGLQPQLGGVDGNDPEEHVAQMWVSKLTCLTSVVGQKPLNWALEKARKGILNSIVRFVAFIFIPDFSVCLMAKRENRNRTRDQNSPPFSAQSVRGGRREAEIAAANHERSPWLISLGWSAGAHRHVKSFSLQPCYLDPQLPTWSSFAE